MASSFLSFGLTNPLSGGVSSSNAGRIAVNAAATIIGDPARYLGLNQTQQKPQPKNPELYQVISQINDAGLLSRPNKFYVDIALSGLFSAVKNTNKAFAIMKAATDANVTDADTVGRRLRLFCENAELPGRSFAAYDHHVYGPSYKRPYQPVYADMTISVIGLSDMLERTFFDAWMNAVQDPFTQDFNYSSEYTTDIFVYQQDEMGNSTYPVQFFSAWPISINSNPLSFGALNTYHRIDVTFSYLRWMNKRLALNIQNGAGQQQTVQSFNQTVRPIQSGTIQQPPSQPSDQTWSQGSQSWTDTPGAWGDQ